MELAWLGDGVMGSQLAPVLARRKEFSSYFLALLGELPTTDRCNDSS